jgi:hypothetical protein
MLPGQRVQDYVDVADRLAQTFGAQDCRVRTCKNPYTVQLWLLIRDPLVAAVEPLQPADSLADGLPVARAEDGSTWLLRLLGNHVLIVGATGAGKSGLLWAIIASLSGFIRACAIVPPAFQAGLVHVAFQGGFVVLLWSTHPIVTSHTSWALAADEHQRRPAPPAPLVVRAELCAVDPFGGRAPWSVRHSRTVGAERQGPSNRGADCQIGPRSARPSAPSPCNFSSGGGPVLRRSSKG